MSRIYFGDWSCAADMDLSLRGLREKYDHADSEHSLAPYPLGENPPARVYFAASPSCLRSRKPLIVMARGGHFHIQRRMDRWKTDKIWFTEDVRALQPVFADLAAAEAFVSLQDRAFEIELETSSFDEGHCSGCGCYLAGPFLQCGDCSAIEQIQFVRHHPQAAAQMRANAERRSHT